MANALQASREEFLSKCFDSERAAVEFFDERTRNVRAPFRGSMTSMADVLHASSEGEDTPLHCTVHEEWPWHPIGFLQLEQRVETIAKEERDELEDALKGSIINMWRGTYRDALMTALSHHPDAIRIKHPEAHKKEEGQGDIVSLSGMGFLDERMFARFLEATGGVPLSRPVQLHGATYACCPTQFGLQLGAARNLGIFLPAKPAASDAKEAMHVHALRNALYKYSKQLCTDISFGVLMDCIGLINKGGVTHEDSMMRRHTHRMTSTDTIIFPDQHPIFHHTSALVC